MSEHNTSVKWQRQTASFEYQDYNRQHTVMFNPTAVINASAAGELKGDANNVDPEQVLTASISSCHMLTFLAVTSKKRYVVDAYEDAATGFMEKNEAGFWVVSRVVLRPKAKFSGAKIPTLDELHALHESAHKYCVIANSVLSKVEIVPVMG